MLLDFPIHDAKGWTNPMVALCLYIECLKGKVSSFFIENKDNLPKINFENYKPRNHKLSLTFFAV
jgi:hypothetical protein